MKVIIASILSVVFSTLLLLQVKALDEIPLTKILSTSDIPPPGEKWFITTEINAGNPPGELIHPQSGRAHFLIRKVEGGISFQNNDAALRHGYFIVDPVSEKWSGIRSIDAGAEHKVSGNKLIFFLE